MDTKSLVKKNIKDGYKLLEEIKVFCERKQNEINHLELIIPNIVPSMTFLSVLYDEYDELKPVNISNVNFFEDLGYQIIWQYKSVFLNILSIIEFCTYEIIIKSNDSPLKPFVKKVKLYKLLREIFDLNNLEKELREEEKEKFKKFKKYLKNEPPVKTFREILQQSRKINLISQLEKQDWEFFIDVRNSISHNNAIPKKEITHKICGNLYHFNEDKMMKGKFNGLIIFSKRLTEVFYDWAKKHNDIN